MNSTVLCAPESIVLNRQQSYEMATVPGREPNHEVLTSYPIRKGPETEAFR